MLNDLSQFMLRVVQLAKTSAVGDVADCRDCSELFIIHTPLYMYTICVHMYHITVADCGYTLCGYFNMYISLREGYNTNYTIVGMHDEEA